METTSLSKLINYYQTIRPIDYQKFISQVENELNIFLKKFNKILSSKQLHFFNEHLQMNYENVFFKIDILYDYLYVIINDIVRDPKFEDFIELYAFQINGYTFLQHYFAIKHLIHPQECKWNIYNTSSLVDECELMKTILTEHYNQKYREYRRRVRESMEDYVCRDVCHSICEYI